MENDKEEFKQILKAQQRNFYLLLGVTIIFFIILLVFVNPLVKKSLNHRLSDSANLNENSTRINQ